MANHNNSGVGQRSADEDRTSWRPNDDENHSHEPDRDRERERDPRSTERYGQGQSGYSAGRHGDDFSQGDQNRNPSYPGSDDRPASRPGMGLDDRPTGYRGSRDERGTGVYRGMGGHRGKGPQNWQRSDERIHESVNEALTDHDHIDATHIEVTVVNGDVTLSGTVEDRGMKRLAEDCVEQVLGVREVQNHLRLQRNDGRGTSPEGNGRIASTAPPMMSRDRKPRA